MLKYIVTASLLLGFSIAQATAKPKDAKKRKVASAVTENDVRDKARQLNLSCNEGQDITVEKFTHKYRYSYEKPTDQEHEAVFYIASCLTGAYNSSSVIFNEDPYDGLLTVALASPETSSKSHKLAGWVAETILGDASYDAKTNILTTFSKGRGIGDISVRGTYTVFENKIVLRKYEEDDTVDGKINPKVIFETKEPLK